ncbi:MAG: dockerin type I repeat-containing protein [Clostridiales bacterium]|nr:dockerin type I repeat-containing protein [Clostridiales bacterium]
MKTNWKKSLCLPVVLCLLLALMPGLSLAADPSQGVNVATPTMEEIRTYYQNRTFDLNYQDQFVTQPSISDPFVLGELTQATQENALGVMNFVRYIAGIDANVTLDASHIEHAQAAALACAIYGNLTHTPDEVMSKPVGMSDAMWKLCNDGGRATNIGVSGSTNPNFTSGMLQERIIKGWMSDNSAGNIVAVGHRRWILNPKMGKSGFGQVNALWGTYHGRFSAMYAHDSSNSGATQTGVVWPAQNQPVELFAAIDPWSISMNVTNLVAANIQVTLTRRGDGRVWNFSNTAADGLFYVNNQYYGQPGCIIFRPDGVGSYAIGDVFDVVITGANVPISYTVRFFTIEGEYPIGPPTIVPGDADCNTVVDAADAALVLRYLAGLAELSDEGKLNANVNGGELDSSDAAMILRYLAGLITLD